MTFTRTKAIIVALAVPLALSAVAIGWAQSSLRPDEQRPAPRETHPGMIGPDTMGPMTGDMRRMMQMCTQMMTQMMEQPRPPAEPKGGD
jgi:hypothetical protein